MCITFIFVVWPVLFNVLSYGSGWSINAVVAFMSISLIASPFLYFFDKDIFVYKEGGHIYNIMIFIVNFITIITSITLIILLFLLICAGSMVKMTIFAYIMAVASIIIFIAILTYWIIKSW
jgi:hypothetical protein